jgi:hypothetical protein
MKCFGGCFGDVRGSNQQLGGPLAIPAKLKDAGYLQQQHPQRCGSPVSDCSEESQMKSGSGSSGSSASCYAADVSNWRHFDQAPKANSAKHSKVSVSML